MHRRNPQSTRALVATMAAVVVLSGCREKATTGPSRVEAKDFASALRSVSGDQQIGPVGAALTQQLAVKVVDAGGLPVEGAIPHAVKLPASTDENATVALALNPTVPPNAVALARRNCAPARLPRLHVIDAVPLAPVIELTLLTVPPPTIESVQEIGSPAMTFPYWSVTRTVSWSGKATLTGPVCPLPAT